MTVERRRYLPSQIHGHRISTVSDEVKIADLMIGLLIVIGVLVFILLARYTGLGRDWWPRDPFSH